MSELFTRPRNYVDVVEQALEIELSSRFLQYSTCEHILTTERVLTLHRALLDYHGSPVITPERLPYATFLEFKVVPAELEYLEEHRLTEKLLGIFKEPLVFFEQVLVSDPIHTLFCDLNLFGERPKKPLHGYDFLKTRLWSLLGFLAKIAPFLRSHYVLPVAMLVSQYRLEDGAYANNFPSLYLSDDWDKISEGKFDSYYGPQGSLTGDRYVDLFGATKSGGYPNGALPVAELYGEVRDTLRRNGPVLFDQFDRRLPPPGPVPGFEMTPFKGRSYAEVYKKYAPCQSVMDIKDIFDAGSRVYERLWRIVGQSAFQEQILRRLFSQSSLLWHSAFDIESGMTAAVRWDAEDSDELRHEREKDLPVPALDIYEAYITALMGTLTPTAAETTALARFSSNFGITSEHLTLDDVIRVRENEEVFLRYRKQIREILDYARQNLGTESPAMIARHVSDIENEFFGFFESRIGKTNFFDAMIDRSKECALAVALTGGAMTFVTGSFLETLYSTAALSAAMAGAELAKTAERRETKRQYLKHWSMLRKTPRR